MSKMLAAVRAGTIKFPVSEAGAGYQHRILLRAYMRAYSGGGMFGYDTRTLHANEPELFAYLTRLERYREPMRFKDVPMARMFDFVSGTALDSFTDRCVRVSVLRYRSVRTGTVYRVGSINVPVFHVEGFK